MLTVAVDEKLVKKIDDAIKITGFYSSRSEFLKDAIRKNVIKLFEFNEELKNNASLRKIHEEAEKLAAKARARGYKGGLLTREERIKIANEYIKENNISVEF